MYPNIRSVTHNRLSLKPNRPERGATKQQRNKMRATEETLAILELNQDIVVPWVEALRSGEYEQGRATLFNKHYNTFCCLGVMELVCNPSVESDEELDELGTPEVLETPLRLKGASDLPQYSLEFHMGQDEFYKMGLTALNDGLEYTFLEIADLLEGKEINPIIK
jgi:hypothetical protein